MTRLRPVALFVWGLNADSCPAVLDAALIRVLAEPPQYPRQLSRS